MIRYLITLYILSLQIFHVDSFIYAQTYQSGEVRLNNGQNKVSSTNFQTTAVIGQPIVGAPNSSSFSMITGFIPYYLSAQFYDVSVANLVLDPTTVGAGNSFNLSFDIVSNESGNIGANDLGIGIYLSSDQVIDAGELVELVYAANIINGNSTYAYPQAGDINSIEIPLSTTPDNYYIIVSLDDIQTIPETDESNNVFTTPITISDDSTPPVIANVTRDNFFQTGSKVTAQVNDNIGVGKVYVYHRGIRSSDNNDWGSPVEAILESGIYSVTFEAAWLDELGVEFWFEAFDTSNNRDSTEVFYTFYQTVGNELTLPTFPAGRTPQNYRIFSIPFDLSQKNPATVFAKLGNYDPTKWRMYHYLNGSTTEYNKGWSTIEHGKSYWLIHDVANVGQMLVGEGEAVQSNKESPYTLSLIQGWNQIGNPYRFAVSWNDILTASGNPTTVERFRVWNNGGFEDGTTLTSFGGGFVFTTAPVTLTVPVTSTTGGRMAAENPYLNNSLASDNWQVGFRIANADLSFDLGGLGMHTDARIGKDYFDDVAMPRLPEYIDLNFDHPEYFIPRFNKDVVPLNDTYAWDFTVNKVSREAMTTITWDNSSFGDNDKVLFLIDKARNAVIDMREVSTYQFYMESKYDFRVVFGSVYAIDEILIPEQVALGQNYPNPFNAKTIIPLALPAANENYNIELVVINQLGQLVKELYTGDLAEGYHEFEWDRTNQEGRQVKAGLYLYQLRVSTGIEILSFTKHSIIY
jgi:hypothetical protein